MKLSVFGIGYVGSVVAGCMAKSGHEVVAVDVNPSKVAVVNNGCSPIKEAGLDDADRRCRGARTVARDDIGGRGDRSYGDVVHLRRHA